MAEVNKAIGAIGWIDLTVGNAEEVRSFYQEVTGWKSSGVDMGDYKDYCMIGPEDETMYAGICHAKGKNEGLPAQWLIYINVADLEASLEKCIAKGGKTISPIKHMGKNKMAIIQDPAGAVAALFEHNE
jgi:predicted enzyme related to lactoylglutathione lyase